MSTGKINKQPGTRFAELAKHDEVIFHVRDLANLWGITNSNTLHTTLKRYAHNGLLHRIYRGFYALHPASDLNQYLLGIKALHGYAYISTETVLQEAGIIMQSIPYITLVGSQSKRFTIGEWSYLSRKLQDKHLYHSIGTYLAHTVHRIKWATTERAVADLLYFNPRAHFDNEQKIDWKKIRELQQQIGYPLTPHRYSIV